MLSESFLQERNEHRKDEGEIIAIVASGGGISCAFSAGALQALTKYFDFDNPNYAYGASGSAANVCCYAAGQMKECVTFWSEEVSKPGIVIPGLINQRIDRAWLRKFLSAESYWQTLFESHIDVDHIVDELVGKVLNVDALRQSFTEVLLAATDYQTAETHHFSTKDSAVPVLQAIRASKAIPIAYDKKVEIGGRDYIDGELTCPPVDAVRKAIQKGATTVIVIDNSNLDSPSMLLPFARAGKDIQIVKAVGTRLEKLMGPQPTGANIIVIKPNQPLRTLLFNNDPDAIEEAIKEGHKSVKESRELNGFFNARARKLAA